VARPPVFLVALSILLGAGCSESGLPSSFAPPPQRPALTYAHFVMMSDPDAGSYIVQGFRDHSEGSWRWAHDHPVLRFTLPPAGPLKFSISFTLPEGTFHETGPVTLALSINGHLLERLSCGHAGDYQVIRPVPDAYLNKPGVNLVSIDPDKTATPEKLGFVLLTAGFVE